MPIRSPNDVSTWIGLVLGVLLAMMLTRFSKVFGLPTDVVWAILGDIGVQEVAELATGVSPTPASYSSSWLPVITSYFSLRSLTTW